MIMDKLPSFFHMFANGDDAANFIQSEDDFQAAFNRVGVCAYKSNVTVLSFSIENSHSHKLLYGIEDFCYEFKDNYESSSKHYIARTRGSLDNVRLDYELQRIDSEEYLRNVGTYSIIQPTKDGKRVMPYDYKWGTGSMYFRPKNTIPIWNIDEYGHECTPVRLKDLTAREREKILHTRFPVPGEWLVCNGILLPSNYVDVQRFESIYRTPNCFRVFLSNSKDRDKIVLDSMSRARGITLEDLEARQICRETALRLLNFTDIRKATIEQRLALARVLRKENNISYRQLSFLCRIPENELRKYL